jgi:hypothetical protein
MRIFGFTLTLPRLMFGGALYVLIYLTGNELS